MDSGTLKSSHRIEAQTIWSLSHNGAFEAPMSMNLLPSAKLDLVPYFRWFLYVSR